MHCQNLLLQDLQEDSLVYRSLVLTIKSVLTTEDDLYYHLHIHYIWFRTCLGPIIGGGLVYKVGFQYMAAVRVLY